MALPPPLKNLAAATAQLYAAFAHYPRKLSPMTMYADADDDMKKRLKKARRHELSPDDAWAAVRNYGGDEPSFKYFLPRAIEVASHGLGLSELVDLAHYRKYPEWPGEERLAVVTYVLTRWGHGDDMPESDLVKILVKLGAALPVDTDEMRKLRESEAATLKIYRNEMSLRWQAEEDLKRIRIEIRQVETAWTQEALAAWRR